MAEEAPKYYAVLTDAGAALEARALAEGKGIVLTHIAVGDANLETVTPDPAVTRLVHEVHRRPIDARSRDEDDPKVTLLHATIPADVGGFWINELGVIGHLEGDEEEILYAYANHGRYYKMLPQDGQTITHELTIPIVQSTDARIVIEVADDGYATRAELEALREELLAGMEAATGLHAAVAGLQEQVARLAARLTACQIGQARTIATPAATPAAPSGAGALNPAGESIAPGVTVAPLTIVEAGGCAPRQAALAVLLDDHQPITTE